MKRFICVFIFLFGLNIFAQMEDKTSCVSSVGKCKDIKLNKDFMKLFEDSGVYLTRKQTEDIYSFYIKYDIAIKTSDKNIKNIDSYIKEELIKDNPDRDIIKKLIFDKKNEESNKEYYKIECDLDILSILTSEQIKLIKSYRK